MVKLKLSFEEEVDFKLIGISCHDKDYKLCWEINKCLNLDLVRKKDYTIQQNNTLLKFPFYEYVDEENFKNYQIIKNRTTEGYLMSELKQFDYLFKLEGTFKDIDQICQLIKSCCKSILMANVVEIEKLKNYQYLIF